jgi:hypothetical protein
VSSLFSDFVNRDLACCETCEMYEIVRCDVLFWVNWICAIITLSFLNHTITIQETMSLPLQFCICLRYAIMYVWRRFWAHC